MILLGIKLDIIFKIISVKEVTCQLTSGFFLKCSSQGKYAISNLGNIGPFIDPNFPLKRRRRGYFIIETAMGDLMMTRRIERAPSTTF